MEGRKFSSSRQVVIYVRDFLDRYDVDALRYYVAVAGPENQDTDFTWSEFVRRNNDELVATWGNLVNRAVSFAAQNIGSIPAAGELTDADQALLARSRQAFGAVGEHLARRGSSSRSTRRCATVAEANKYFSEQAPWKLREADPDRMRTILHVALQAGRRRQDAAHPVPAALVAGRCTRCSAARGLVGHAAGRGGGRGGRPVLPGDHRRLRRRRRAGSRGRSRPGTPLAVPTPLFTKLDPSVVDEELARLGAE